MHGGLDASQIKQVDIFLTPKLDQAKMDAIKKELNDKEVS